MIVRDIRRNAVFSAEKMGKVSLAVGTKLYAGLNCLEPGQEHQAHVHAGQDKMYLVLDGEGEVTVGEQQSRVGRGDLALAAAGVSHSLRNPGPERLVVLVIFAPPPAR